MTADRDGDRKIVIDYFDTMADSLFALADMRGNLKMAMGIFIASMILLRWNRLGANSRGQDRWFPVYLFALGPLIALAWFVVQRWLVPNGPHSSWQEVVADLGPILIIGVFVGTVAMVAAFAEAITRRMPVIQPDREDEPPSGT